jgi:hypothetical protein
VTFDGRDFLLWQRNPSVGNLADWQANYGFGSLSALTDSSNSAVPEPGSALLTFFGLVIAMGQRIFLQS